MKAAVYTLPPNVYIKKEEQNEAEATVATGEESLQPPLAHLEIEVSRLNFIADKSIKAQTSGAASLYKNPTHKTNKSKQQKPVTTAAASASANSSASAICKRPRRAEVGSIRAKIIWWGEQRETAGSISISCGGVGQSNPVNSHPTSNSESKHRNHKQRSSQQQRQRQRYKQQQQQQTQQHPHRQQEQHQHQQHTNKLRYSVQSSLALFLDYLYECPPIEIVASGICKGKGSSSGESGGGGSNVNDQAANSKFNKVSDSNSESDSDPCSLVPLGQTRLPLPAPLLRKYAANYVSGCNFEYKTKIYALYRHVESGATCGQVQQQQQLKVGEIQLRFRMLFASKTNANVNAKADAAAAAAAAAIAAASSSTSTPAIQVPGSPNLLQDQLTNGNFTNTLPLIQNKDQTEELITGKPIKITNSNNNNINNNNGVGCGKKSSVLQANGNLRASGKSNELMEAIKKLDADLAALFAAAEPLDQLKKQQQSQPTLWSDTAKANVDADAKGSVSTCSSSSNSLEESKKETLLFRNVNELQLNLEALTLQSEGTQRMELLQSEVRPIFTVECQLSHELIRQVPRYDMFQIMQFESEKFNSLTQCTRFGQSACRQVHLPSTGEQLGRIDFTVWWREPGTCLNEMLGMGRLELAELYAASLLEQCKCITIQRRGIHLASLYLKISLQLAQSKSSTNGNVNEQQQEPAENAVDANSNGCNATANNSSNSSAAGAAVPALNNNSSDSTDSNNKPLLDNNNFMAETNKVRLLRGYIYASETRQLPPAVAADCQELTLQPFWQAQPLRACADQQGAFHLQEQFALINDDKFLACVERQQLLLELGPLGAKARLPLHQFYIAYRDAAITNHLCKGKLPVISFDGWASIEHPQTREPLGELKCLLAIGSDTQITQLKQQRGFTAVTAAAHTADLLDKLQNALSAPPTPSPSLMPLAAAVAQPPTSSSSGSFTFMLHILGAAGLPLNPGYVKLSKKQSKRQAAAKRFAPNEPPSTYVSFQALNCLNAPTYKSHEGLVYATPIVECSTTPQWRSKFQVTISADYLSNPQKLFILKLWKKAMPSPAGDNTGTGTATALTPTPLEDAIVGFAALNLSQQTLPCSWHNIVDFNGRITGGLELQVQPMPQPGSNADDAIITQFEQSLELTHLQLGQAIKRKFTELEQISQRLRTRLVDVTGEQPLSAQFDLAAALENWQTPCNSLEEEQDDALVADFERALRTPSPVLTPDAAKEQE